MVIFSDLDRSIIYSNKFLDTKTQYKNIEIYNGKQISYISLDTLKLIKKIQERGMFIPTTTRTKEQFSRIRFCENKICFPWAITSNGGVILKDNKVLESWQKKIKDIVKKSEDIESMVEKFENYKYLPGIKSFKIAEDLFFYIVVDYFEFNIDMIEEYIKDLDSNNWKMYISGRKIYFLPKGINKENAINHVVNEMGISDFFAIGDSSMDYGMLKSADTGYILKHGELLNQNQDIDISGLKVSAKEGMKATEEILFEILNENSSTVAMNL